VDSLPALSCERLNGGSGLAIRKDAIAVPLASKRPGAGGAGMPVSTIGPGRKAKSAGARKVAVIGNAGSSKRPRWRIALPSGLQLEPRSRPRASAQHKILGILVGDLAAGPVVTCCFRSGAVRRVSISVRAVAVRRYDACATAAVASATGPLSSSPFACKAAFWKVSANGPRFRPGGRGSAKT
jgi:hypothetical protein